MNKSEIELVRKSYENWSDDPKMILTFYDQLLSAAPELAPMFTNTDMEKHNELLRKVINTLIEHVEGHAEATTWLKELRSMHTRGLEVRAEYFPLWKNSMLFAIAAHDEDWEKKVNIAWNHLFDEGIEFMVR